MDIAAISGPSIYEKQQAPEIPKQVVPVKNIQSEILRTRKNPYEDRDRWGDGYRVTISRRGRRKYEASLKTPEDVPE